MTKIIKRISEVQAKTSLRSANEYRQYGQEAVPRYIVAGRKIMD